MSRPAPSSPIPPLLLILLLASLVQAQELKLDLKPGMVANESELGNPEAIVDEQRLIGDGGCLVLSLCPCQLRALRVE